METKYASPERSGSNEVQRQYQKISTISYLKEMVNALPYVVTVLNNHRQVVFSNETLLKQLKVSDLKEFLGKRPGEFLNCANADCESGCGTSENCRVCGAVNTILLSLMENRKVVDECRITSVIEGEEESHDFEVTAAPFHYEGEKFIVFSLADISGEKRRRMLERIFFHDILNTAGNVKGLAELLGHIDEEKQKKELLELLSKVSAELVEEIEAQKQLTSAETGELVPKRENINSLDLLQAVASQFSTQKKQAYKILIDENCHNTDFSTDRSLLSRIIKNMLKNAIEASGMEEDVSLGVMQVNSSLRFYVKNKGYIPREIQLEIFKRSFSTKGIDRGLGTYSMKLLGEKYLKGKVHFVTNEEKGTTFFFDHPV